ncbi:hypothetical protein BDN72DRAFT_136978 [Pluteus cervinus]|uniref:Uncharacterized protein n=1 Tax=Pluteus cervinus TaxID=181527 RepID=A0ACD3B6H6_9AGAR|nr:hypothetical protein BDN72DRAFT_136978 [Pluteus cervinus]
MESRKRPHTDDVDTSITKKRVLADSVGNPHVNGTHIEHDEPREGDNLELFRKQAIYRRMKHYSREHERSLSRITQLERQNNLSQAGFTAIKACWTQVVETIRMLVKPELHPEANGNVQDLFDLTAHIQEEAFQDLSNLLNEYTQTTQALVAKFVELSGSPEAAQMHDNACLECKKLQTECISLRSQMEIIQKRFEDSEAQRDQVYAALLAAESRVERMMAESTQTQQAMKQVEVKKDASEEPQKPFSPEQAASPQANGTHDPADPDVLHEMVKSREARIAELEQEAAALRSRNLALEAEVRIGLVSPIRRLIYKQAKSLTLPLLASNPIFTHLYEQAKNLSATVDAQRHQIADLLNNRSAHISRKEWEEKLTNSANQATQEYKNMLAKRDVELARIRDQREQYRLEINERKQIESARQASNEEIRKLAESRADRIAVLESELRRIKTQLAANAGYEELMLFFCNGNLEEAEFLESLKSRVIAAEDRATAMEQTLASQTDSADVEKHMKAEADACRQLAEVTREVDRYRSIFGDVANLSTDVQALVQQLQEKEKEIQRLRLLDQQREQAETALYTEIDKLSTAWEALDRQVQSKIFDLTSMEERVSRANNDVRLTISGSVPSVLTCLYSE